MNKAYAHSVLRLAACIAFALVGCGPNPPHALENRFAGAPQPQLATACTSAAPRTPVANLLGVEIAKLPGPWKVSLPSMIDDGFALIFARAADEEAVLVARNDRVISAVSAGTPCSSLSLIHHCRIAGEPDPWVFAELAATSMCVDLGTPVVRAWRVRRDGTLVVVPASSVTCGSSHCL